MTHDERIILISRLLYKCHSTLHIEKDLLFPQKNQYVH